MVSPGYAGADDRSVPRGRGAEKVFPPPGPRRASKSPNEGIASVGWENSKTARAWNGGHRSRVRYGSPWFGRSVAVCANPLVVAQ